MNNKNLKRLTKFKTEYPEQYAKMLFDEYTDESIVRKLSWDKYHRNEAEGLKQMYQEWESKNNS